MSIFKNLRVEVDLQSLLKRIMWLLILFFIGGVLMVVTSWAYDGNWLGVNSMIYKDGIKENGKIVKVYYFGEFIFFFGQVAGQLLWAIGIKKVISIFRLGAYSSMWFIDLMSVCLWYTIFRNTKIHSPTQINLAEISTGIFLLQVLLDVTFPPFRKLKLFN